MAKCTNCGAEFAGEGALCPPCSGSGPAPAAPAGGADDAVSVVIPYKNPKALIGYYLAVFGLIPVAGLVLGPAAIILGALGLRDRRRDPRRHGLAHAIVALVLGSIDLLYHLALIVGIIIAARRP